MAPIEWTFTKKPRTFNQENYVDYIYSRMINATDVSGDEQSYEEFITMFNEANKIAMDKFNAVAIDHLREHRRRKKQEQEKPKKPDREPDGYTWPEFRELRPPDGEEPTRRETSSERRARERRERERLATGDIDWTSRHLYDASGAITVNTDTAADNTFIGLSEQVRQGVLRPYDIYEERNSFGYVTWLRRNSDGFHVRLMPNEDLTNAPLGRLTEGVAVLRDAMARHNSTAAQRYLLSQTLNNTREEIQRRDRPLPLETLPNFVLEQTQETAIIRRTRDNAEVVLFPTIRFTIMNTNELLRSSEIITEALADSTFTRSMRESMLTEIRHVQTVINQYIIGDQRFATAARASTTDDLTAALTPGVRGL